MTDHPEDLVADVVAAYGGSLVGRIRLQKVVYLLDQLGLNSGFDYSYHHYGPYSAELTSAAMSAQAIGAIQDEPHFRHSDGASYSVFKTERSLDGAALGEMPLEDAKAALDRFKQETATVLELAATIHWLREVEEVPEWEAELSLRKGSKTADGRQDKAVALLKEFGLFH